MDEVKKILAPISGRASVTETVDLGSISGRVKPKTIKNGIHSVPARRSGIKRDSMKTPQCVVDRWTSGSLIRKPKGPFAVVWPRLYTNLVNKT